MDTAPFIPPPGPSGESASAVATALAALMTLIGRAPPIFPAPPASMTRAQEAQMTREYAWEFFRSDPRFAADLCAAPTTTSAAGTPDSAGTRSTSGHPRQATSSQ